MNKKILVIVVIFVLIIAGIFTANKIAKRDRTINTMSNKTNVENNIVNETDNELGNTVNNTEEESNLEVNKQENLEENVYTVVDEKQKAIEIVKQDWGEDNTVNFMYEGQNDKGEYIICVREKATTKAMFWYYVNVETGTFVTD